MKVKRLKIMVSKMIKSWMVLTFVPILVLSAYPIYEEEAGSLQPEPLKEEGHSTAEKTPDKRESSIAKRDRIKRNSIPQGDSPRAKNRRNPNRPRVIYREEQKKPLNLSNIEADAEKPDPQETEVQEKRPVQE
jgi:hypothetical protein